MDTWVRFCWYIVDITQRLTLVASMEDLSFSREHLSVLDMLISSKQCARKYFRVLCERIFTIVFSFGPRRAKQDLMKNDLMTDGFGGNALKFNIKFECSKNVSLLQWLNTHHCFILNFYKKEDRFKNNIFIFVLN